MLFGISETVIESKIFDFIKTKKGSLLCQGTNVEMISNSCLKRLRTLCKITIPELNFVPCFIKKKNFNVSISLSIFLEFITIIPYWGSSKFSYCSPPSVIVRM